MLLHALLLLCGGGHRARLRLSGTGTPVAKRVPALPVIDVVPLAAGGAVFKRGIREVVVRDDLTAIFDPLAVVLADPAATAEVLAGLPDAERGLAEQVLEVLEERGMTGAPDIDAPTDAQRLFYADLGSAASEAAERLAAATVVVVGDNAIARAAVAALVAMGSGTVTLVRDEGLAGTNDADPVPPPAGVTVAASLELDGADLVCATSTVGEVAALYDVNRAALLAGVPSLPAWLVNLQGYLGPLTHPRETACLRCYRLRADSNDDRFEIGREVRAHLDGTAAGRVGAALPPMTAALGNLLAMEVAKFLGGFAPSDVVGRSVVVNLVALRLSAGRVLKVPRCPDCGDVAGRSPEVITVGPLITDRG